MVLFGSTLEAMPTSQQKIEWNNELSIGVSHIDEDHKSIIGKINLLDDSLSEHDFFLTLHEVVCDLIKRSERHLECEEKQLLKNGYPNLQERSEYHLSYMEKLTEFALCLSSRNCGDYYKIKDYLQNWWMNHITEEDRKTRDFFSQSFQC